MERLFAWSWNVLSIFLSSQARNIDIEVGIFCSRTSFNNILYQTAKAFWVVLLAQKYPIVNDLIEFINVCVWCHNSPSHLCLHAGKGNCEGRK